MQNLRRTLALRIVALIGLLAAWTGPVVASPRPPASGTPPAAEREAPPAAVAVLFVDAHGAWDRTVQESFESLGFKPEGDVTWVTWRHLFDGGRLARLGAARQEALLHFPDLLLEARRRPEITSVRYVVKAALRSRDSGQMNAVLIDVVSGERSFLPSVTTGSKADAMALLCDGTAHAIALQTEPVWGYVPGKQYHVVGCDHVRKDDVILIRSAAEARRYGYQPCAVCFPPQGGRHQDRLEVGLGKQVASYIEYRYGLDHDAQRQARVERVGGRLVAANHLDDFEYSFHVLQSEEMNALSAGAGHVFITRGLEQLTAGNDNMLAAILGHEIGHSERHHVVREYREAQTWAILGAVISVATGTNVGGLLTGFAGNLVSRGHSRRFEAEADRAGILYTYGAGYRPEDFELVMNAFKKLEQGRSRTPAWLRTHPSEDQRIQKTRAEVAEIKAFDAVVQRYRSVDPGMGAALRTHASGLLEQRELLAQELSQWQAALGPPTPTVGAEDHPEGDSDRPPLVLPASPAAPAPSPAGTLPDVRKD